MVENYYLDYKDPGIPHARWKSLLGLLGEVQHERRRTLASVGQPRVLPRASNVFNESTLQNGTVVTTNNHSREYVGHGGPPFEELLYVEAMWPDRDQHRAWSARPVAMASSYNSVLTTSLA